MRGLELITGMDNSVLLGVKEKVKKPAKQRQNKTARKVSEEFTGPSASSLRMLKAMPEMFSTLDMVERFPDATRPGIMSRLRMLVKHSYIVKVPVAKAGTVNWFLKTEKANGIK